jgi:hypothetical protein
LANVPKSIVVSLDGAMIREVYERDFCLRFQEGGAGYLKNSKKNTTFQR